MSLLPRILAGAPRANDSSLPSLTEPGAVYQCSWRNPRDCQPLFIDDVGNEKQKINKWKKIRLHHKKDHQWLGASLDVNVNGDSEVRTNMV